MLHTEPGNVTNYDTTANFDTRTYYFGGRPVQFVDLVQDFLRAAATVIPAKAGIQGKGEHGWNPACAGMTVKRVLESFVLRYNGELRRVDQGPPDRLVRFDRPFPFGDELPGKR